MDTSVDEAGRGEESRTGFIGLRIREVKSSLLKNLRRHRQPSSGEDDSLRRARRLDSTLKCPLIVIMTAYLVSHFVGSY